MAGAAKPLASAGRSPVGERPATGDFAHRRPQSSAGNAAVGTSSRSLAHRILVRVMVDGAYAERLLAHELDRSALSSRDRALVCMLVYGSLREAEGLDAALRAALSRPSVGLPVPVRAALRLGAYQLLHTRIPDHCAVNQSVDLVRRYGRLAALVNAVLRRVARQRPEAGEANGAPGPKKAERRAEPEVVVPDHAFLGPPQAEQSTEIQRTSRGGLPDGAAGRPAIGPKFDLAAELRARRGQISAAAWALACRRTPPLCLRVNLQRTSPDKALARLAAAGKRVSHPPHRPLGDLDPCLWLESAGRVTDLPGWHEGWFSVQDTAATWVGGLLPRSDAAAPVVLDMCAAPGGKLMHLLEAWGPDVRALACDLHPGRLGLVAAAAARLGLAPPQLACLDARDPQALRAALAAACLPSPTHILLDAPCSALGTLRRHPERRSRPTDVAGLVGLQAKLLDAAAGLLPSGGHLLYAVCTVTGAEGAAQVAAFLGRHPDFRCLPPPAALAFGRENEAFCSWTDRDGTDSFFGQAMVRD